MDIKTLLVMLAAAILLAALASYLAPKLAIELPGAGSQAAGALFWGKEKFDQIPEAVKLFAAIFLAFSALYMSYGYILGAFSKMKRF